MQVLDWFLREENAEHWKAVKDLSSKDSKEAFETIKKYVLEASRLTSFLALVRICIPSQGQAAQIKNDQGEMVTLKMGEAVVCNAVSVIPMSQRSRSITDTQCAPSRLQRSAMLRCSPNLIK